MSETLPALAPGLVRVTELLPAALPHSTSYFSDHQTNRPLRTFNAGWGSGCQDVFPAPGTQWIQTVPRTFSVVVLLCCFYSYEWLWQKMQMKAQYIHKMGNETNCCLEILGDTKQTANLLSSLEHLLAQIPRNQWPPRVLVIRSMVDHYIFLRQNG